MSNVLEIDRLQVAYGPIVALHDVSLRVTESEIVTIVGANGAGKSTLLKTISGLLHPRAGTLRYHGADLTAKKPHQIVAMGILHIPERREILGRMTVEENLRLGADFRGTFGEVGQDLERMYTFFPQLSERRRQLGGTLSGGEQQMLAIARALMGHPRLLLMDEPSLGLAPVLVQEIFTIIDDLKRQGITILLVEQNAYQALSTADRAYVFKTGKVVDEGPAQAFLSEEGIVKAYLGSKAKS